MLEAVKQKGGTLGYASDALKDDREIVLEAVKRDEADLFNVSDAIWKDRDFIRRVFAAKSDPTTISELQTSIDELQTRNAELVKRIRVLEEQVTMEVFDVETQETEMAPMLPTPKRQRTDSSSSSSSSS